MMKKWYKSKTVWVNVGLATVSVLATLQDTALISDHPGVVAVMGTVIGVVNVLLRTVTKEPIGK